MLTPRFAETKSPGERYNLPGAGWLQREPPIPRQIAHCIACIFAVLLALVTECGAARAGPLHIEMGLQQSGTASWELAAMHDLGIDTRHNLEIHIRQLADNQAGQIALQTGTVDLILSDFIYVALQRAAGNMVTMVPHSLALGGVMVDASAGISDVSALRGKEIASAGTPVDKSFVVLEAYYQSKTGRTLMDDATVRFGAPPLVNQLLLAGRISAALNNWNWNVHAQLAGRIQLISVQQMLAELGVPATPPLLGWVFTDATAASKHEALTAFLDASFETEQALLRNDRAWEDVRPLMDVTDEAQFTAMRDAYRQGIVRSYDPADSKPIEQSFELLAKYGGKAAVGALTSLPDGTLYKGYSKS